MHYVYSEHGGERAIQLPAVGARLRANAAGKSLCGVRPQADAYSANTGAPNHPIARERGGRESIRGIVGNAQGGAGAAKHRDVRERAMHMEVLVPQSTGTCESGQCTGMCWCREAQGRARAALPANSDLEYPGSGRVAPRHGTWRALLTLAVPPPAANPAGLSRGDRRRRDRTPGILL
jgi:hypothetical protein